ncbi:MAG: hypothetical protein WCA10_10615 [Terracidiphilus sp.]
MIALFMLVCRSIYRGLREHALSSVVTSANLHSWWLIFAGFFLFACLLSVAIFVGVFGKRLNFQSQIASVSNIVVAWTFFALATIAADPIVISALATVGLSSLQYWLFAFAFLWVFVFLYVCFNDVDKVRTIAQLDRKS